jgi:uncharacterized RDD family membrane protein YckC
MGWCWMAKIEKSIEKRIGLKKERNRFAFGTQQIVKNEESSLTRGILARNRRDIWNRGLPRHTYFIGNIPVRTFTREMIRVRAACYDPTVPTGTSAAQNGPVIRICPKCGALSLNDAENCAFCEDPIEDEASLQPVAADSIVEDQEPEWQQEVSRRLDRYRARRQRLNPDEAQSGLPFRKAPEVVEEPRERPRSRPVQRSRQSERMEICVQPELDFSSSSSDRAHPQTALVPVACLAERRWAGMLDAFFLGMTCAGFLALFHSLGGEITFEKTDALVYFSILYLFYAQYFFLFTTLAGATPGMQLRGLTIVRLDGSLPDTHQLLWRSFGYLLAGATLMLGFLWSLWDEDHFTWQDRISQTYVTAAMPLLDDDPIQIHADQRTFAHK